MCVRRESSQFCILSQWQMLCFCSHNWNKSQNEQSFQYECDNISNCRLKEVSCVKNKMGRFCVFFFSFPTEDYLGKKIKYFD